ncbi:hypothetical protein HDU76_008633 [Blyttiomyces sp. JEL0837]|nr:hypothetical protein HDU76_008633 [Blyttiomyces sp. JEL0837]
MPVKKVTTLPLAKIVGGGSATKSKISKGRQRNSFGIIAMTLIRIAILQCGFASESAQAVAGGDYGHMFKNLINDAVNQEQKITSKELKVEIDVFDATAMHLPEQPRDYDAILLSGSKHGANDDFDWLKKLERFLQNVYADQSSKLIGICFGHQIIAKALGGVVEENPKGWEVGWTPMTLTDDGKAYFEQTPAHLSFHSMHKDYVSQPPEGFKVLMATDKCAIQSMVKDDTILTIQAHPEFTDEFVREDVIVVVPAMSFRKTLQTPFIPY